MIGIFPLHLPLHIEFAALPRSGFIKSSQTAFFYFKQEKDDIITEN